MGKYKFIYTISVQIDTIKKKKEYCTWQGFHSDLMGEIRSFTNKQKPKEFSTTNPGVNLLFTSVSLFSSTVHFLNNFIFNQTQKN